MNISLEHPTVKIIALSVAAIFGVNARYWLGMLIESHTSASFPWATIAINLSGSLLIGILMGLTLTKFQSDSASQLRLIIGTGFLGTYTTFSAFSMDTVALGIDRHGSLVILNILISVAGGCLAAWAGYMIGKAI